jgi:branched-chain amino acid transport system substrate-binding protein
MARVGKKAATSREELGKSARVRVSLAGRMLIGSGDLVLDERRFPGRQARLVFAYLVAERARPVLRDDLAEAIWGETPPPTWEKALIGIVSKLRSLLAECGLEEDAAITSAFGCYQLQLPAGSWIDLEAAREAIDASDEAFEAGRFADARAQADEVATIARRPFLAGEEGAWVEAKRRELDGLLIRALDRLTDACLATGEVGEAVAWADEAVMREPLREAGYQRLMRAHAAADNHAEALRAYERCRQQLAEELGTHPSRATQALHLEILRGEGRTAGNADAGESAVAETPQSDAVPSAAGRRRVRRIAVVAAFVVVAGAAAVAGVLVANRGNGTTAVQAASGSVAVIDPAGTGIGTLVGLHGSASSIAVGGGAVWAVDADDGTVARIDPVRRAVVKTFEVDGTPTAVAAGSAGVWVAEGRSSVGSGLVGDVLTVGVAQIDPKSNVVARTFTLPKTSVGDASPQPLAVGRHAVWIVGPDRVLYRLDAASGHMSAVAQAKVAAVVATPDVVWADDGERTLMRIDPRRGRVTQRITLAARGLGEIAVGGGAVWVVDPYQGVVWRIVPNDRPVARTVDVGIRAGGLAFGEGGAWVANGLTGAVIRIDPETATVTRRISMVDIPGEVAVGAGAVWVGVSSAGPTQPAGSGLAKGTEALPASTCGGLVYGGRNNLDYLIASDLPLQGPARASTLPMTDAIRFVLQQHGFRAGRFHVGYQSCDDSTAQAGDSVLTKCRANAKAYAADADLLGLIGPYSSGCALAELPLLSRAPSGPLAVISGQNTKPGLTHAVVGSTPGTLALLYAAGRRNYARLIAPDDVQGAGDAILARRLGLKRVYVLRSSDSDDYGLVVSDGFVRAARQLGVDVVGSAAWNSDDTSFERIATAVARTRPDGIFLGGYPPRRWGDMIRTFRARLGERVKIIASDGFTSLPSLRDAAGQAAIGMYVSYPGVPNPALPATGRKFVRAFATREPAAVVVSYAAVYAAQATEILLDAIAKSDGTRTSVTRQLLAAKVKGGLLGDFRLDPNGDIDPSPVTIFRVVPGRRVSSTLLPDFDGGVIDRVVKVPLALLR